MHREGDEPEVQRATPQTERPQRPEGAGGDGELKRGKGLFGAENSDAELSDYEGGSDGDSGDESDADGGETADEKRLRLAKEILRRVRAGEDDSDDLSGGEQEGQSDDDEDGAVSSDSDDEYDGVVEAPKWRPRVQVRFTEEAEAEDVISGYLLALLAL